MLRMIMSTLAPERGTKRGRELSTLKTKASVETHTYEYKCFCIHSASAPSPPIKSNRSNVSIPFQEGKKSHQAYPGTANFLP